MTGMTKSVTAVSLALVCALSLTAYGSSNTVSRSGFVPALDENTECTLNFAGGYSNFEALEEQIDKFRVYYPKINIVYTSLDDYDNTLITALGSEEAPDLFTTKNWMLTNPDVSGTFEYTEDLADPSLGFNLASIRAEYLVMDTEGKLPMIPVFANAYGMLVNEDIFRKEKLDVPTSPAEMEEVAGQLKDRGYAQPVVGYNGTKGLFEPVALGAFFLEASKNPDMIHAVNEQDEAAGESLRPVVETALDFLDRSQLDLTYCTDQIEDNYNALIMRFFEGDVPMAIVVADTASGTRKRESQSDSYSQNPFTYGFHPLPIGQDGLYLFTQAAQCFLVNKHSKNLSVANEFMRFLINEQPLNEMASTKRLLTITDDISEDDIYASFRNIKPENTINISDYGVNDQAVNMIRSICMDVANGNATLDDALSNISSYTGE